MVGKAAQRTRHLRRLYDISSPGGDTSFPGVGTACAKMPQAGKRKEQHPQPLAMASRPSISDDIALIVVPPKCTLWVTHKFVWLMPVLTIAHFYGPVNKML